MADTTNIFEIIKTGNADQVKSFLENRPDAINATQQDGSTPLHLAAKQGDGELIKLLLEHGADINATNAEGCTPMELAIRSGHDAAKWFSL